MEHIRQNSFYAWLLASRPKTLTGAAVPVMIGLSQAWADSSETHHFLWLPALLCLLFAFVMQIDANFVNDYFDFCKGADDEHRLGPRRACAQGWISSRMMIRGIFITTIIACLIGLPLIYYGGISMIIIGALCVLFCFLYTTKLSYVGLGDLLVLVFFGIVPVCVTYYLQHATVTTPVFLSSLACGMVIDTLLVVNNYRDRDNDLRTGKLTLVVRIGERPAELLYLALGVAACLLGAFYLSHGGYFKGLLPFVYLLLHVRTYRKMTAIKRGKALNLVLGENARNMFVYGLLFVAGVLIDMYC